ncbi:Sua5/YciO/YrdC/YwlC family protein [Actinobacillus equuli]|uniref:Sua5/YciO/YrdC/YwlC family protein n=1 Tax=Actinobacillus equuli TaxID=718 RepID=UPI0024411398|nr:Sua5/YciO/YrdC/YwlC family protein [Actinobacillus equuli]WGE75779.1 Sua5/YciO/YrdC/YwlC family protein [Actinobacillus equuli subsp. haemolyticus]WGE76483.1 Sua5/YciO/YrdC/YwlC family protein [Actinobacillus equuli subsp. haemolyticus]
MNNLENIVEQLKQNSVVAYPTEAVFGLGCNPNNESAVRALLKLKKRPEEKGLILIAPTKELLLPYIDESKLTAVHWQIFETPSEQAITWVMPAKKEVPQYLTGQFDTIAVRLCRIPAVIELCERTGFALTSTSCNLTGQEPCRTADEVKLQFGVDFPVLEADTVGKTNPSEIRDIFTQHIFRQG